MPRRFLIISNQAAGGFRHSRLRRVVAGLRAAGHEVELYQTRGPGDAAEHLRSRGDALEVVVAAGGDGTINEVVNGLSGRENAALGVLPLGTTNVLARELGLPRSPRRLVDVLAGDRTTAILPGLVGDRRFVMWVGVGIDGWVVSGVELGTKRRWGRLAYALAFPRAARRFGRELFEVTADGERLAASSVIVTRARRYAGSFVLARGAALDRSGLFVVVLVGRGWLTLLRLGCALAFGRLEHARGVLVRTAREVTIAARGHTQSSDCSQVDGDAGPGLPLLLRVEDEPLRVLSGRSR